MNRVCVAINLSLFFFLSSHAHVTGYWTDGTTVSPQSSHVESDSFVEFTIQGFEVQVAQTVMNSDPQINDAVAVLRAQLTNIVHTLPSTAVDNLRKVTIWITGNDCLGRYHPDAGWLRDNGLNPDMALGVELCTPKGIIDLYRLTPSLALHELAHAYHHQFVEQGFDNPMLIFAYESAKESGLYDEVLADHGESPREPYSMTSAIEFFAEFSETVFIVNDHFPFVAVELREIDSETYDAIRLPWYPESAWSSCDLKGEIRSGTGDLEITLTVDNETELDRKLVWVDQAGEVREAWTYHVSAGGSNEISSFISHVWMLQGSDSSCLAFLTFGRSDVSIDF